MDASLVKRALDDPLLRRAASDLLVGRSRVSIFAAMSPQLPVFMVAALLREARERDLPVLLYTAEVGGSFDFLDADSRRELESGRVRIVMVAGGVPRVLAPHIDSLPLSLWDVDRLAGSDLDCDIYAVRATEVPGGFGLGNMVGFTPALLARDDVRVAVEVSHAGEYAGGFADVPLELWRDPVVWHDTVTAPATMTAERPVAGDAVRDRIAELVASIIPPDATIQVGIGGIADALINTLADKPAIRVHSGMLPVTLRRHLVEGRFTGAVATGLSPLAGALRWPDARLLPISETHDPAALANHERLWAINSAFSVDLSGQANAEFVGGVKFTSGGGQLDFMRAAHANPDGASVIALATRTSLGESRIQRLLEPPGMPTTAGSDLDYVVTEFGIARLTGRSLSERAELIAGVAHPDHRSELMNKRRS